MRKIPALILLLAMLSGCSTIAPFNSRAGTIPNAELYVHRKPMNSAMVIQTGKNQFTQIVPWGEITENASDIGFSISEIIRAVTGVAQAFPFSMIPTLVKASFKGISSLKEETKDQEVYKLFWVDKIHTLEANLPDGAKIKIVADEPSEEKPTTEKKQSLIDLLKPIPHTE